MNSKYRVQIEFRNRLGSNSKIADFQPQDILSGNVTASDVEKLKKKELILVAKEISAE